METGEKGITFIGKNTRFEGKLRFQGTMRIDGHFKGEISAQGNLIVGEGALIEGELKVTYASVSGEVHGDIIAEQRVDLRAPSKVFGNIQSPAVVMEEGSSLREPPRCTRPSRVKEGPRSSTRISITEALRPISPQFSER
jgi:cytoskeletal protein CcmA (bactofilin family)